MTKKKRLVVHKTFRCVGCWRNFKNKAAFYQHWNRYHTLNYMEGVDNAGA